MMTEIYSAYRDYEQDYRMRMLNFDNLICRHEWAILYHKKAERKLERSHEGWIKRVLIPLANAISERLGGLPYEFYGPFGPSSETSVYFFTGDGRDICKDETYSLTVRPEFRSNDNLDFYLIYDTGRRTSDYPEGSIGWLNGFNSVYADLPESIDAIMGLLSHHNARKEDASHEQLCTCQARR